MLDKLSYREIRVILEETLDLESTAWLSLVAFIPKTEVRNKSE